MFSGTIRSKRVIDDLIAKGDTVLSSCFMEFDDHLDLSSFKRIEHSTFKGSVGFYKKESASIVHNTFYGDVDFSEQKLGEVRDNHFHKKCQAVGEQAVGEIDNFIENTLYESVSFSDLRFKNFVGNNFSGKASFSEVDFQEKLILLSHKTTGSLSFIWCKFNNTEILIRNETSFSAIAIKYCEFKSKFKIRSLTREKGYEHEQDHKARLQKLEIVDCTATNDAYIRIGYLDIGRFLLRNLRNPRDAEVNIGDCRFENFRIFNFRNLGKFKLYNVNILPEEKVIKQLGQEGNVEFNINNTSIGDTDFQSLVLTSFKKVRMFDNILDGIKYTNVEWPDTVRVGQFRDIEAVKQSKKRDTYRVLKNVAQQNNDSPQALIFYAKEMQYHKEYMITHHKKLIVTRYKRFIRYCNKKRISTRFKNFALTLYRIFMQVDVDIVTLRFNEKTNNFGLNWRRPILLILGIGVVFYALLLLLLNCGEGCSESAKWKSLPLFFSPLHDIESIAAKKCWGFGAYLIDFLFRITEGLLLYQAIIAFRKFSRKV